MFSPISHIRFWSFQIILVCTPSIVFMVYRCRWLLKLTPLASFSAHKVKGNDGGKGAKKEKPKEEISPVRWTLTPEQKGKILTCQDNGGHEGSSDVQAFF